MARIIIIGAGPAGLIVGNYLGKAGHKVTIYEKNKKIISSPCGEAVSINIIEKLKKDIWFNSKPFISRTVKGLKLVFPENNSVFMYKKGCVLDRNKWLNGLRKNFEKQGGNIFLGEEIRENDIQKIQYNYLVGADGPGSVVRKMIGGKVEIEPGTQYKIIGDTSKHKFIEFYMDREVNRYYCWIFPKKKYFNVGSVGPFAEIDRLIQKYNLRGKILKKEAAPVPMNGTKYQQGNILLIGDAAGMANSFSGGGIAPIVCASDILVNCIRENKIENYEKEIREHAAFSPYFYKAKKVIHSLNQQKLTKIGKIVDGCDLLNLPFKIKLKAFMNPEIIKDTLIMIKAFEEGMEYAW